MCFWKNKNAFRWLNRWLWRPQKQLFQFSIIQSLLKLTSSLTLRPRAEKSSLNSPIRPRHLIPSRRFATSIISKLLENIILLVLTCNPNCQFTASGSESSDALKVRFYMNSLLLHSLTSIFVQTLQNIVQKNEVAVYIV